MGIPWLRFTDFGPEWKPAAINNKQEFEIYLKETDNWATLDLSGFTEQLTDLVEPSSMKTIIVWMSSVRIILLFQKKNITNHFKNVFNYHSLVLNFTCSFFKFGGRDKSFSGFTDSFGLLLATVLGFKARVYPSLACFLVCVQWIPPVPTLLLEIRIWKIKGAHPNIFHFYRAEGLVDPWCFSFY